MKKIISILVSVMMILTAIPAFADTAAAAPASVDVYEGLDNFTDEQLKTDYTSENKFTTSTGLSAPLSANITAKVYNDEEVGDYLRVNADATGALGAALSFYDEDINVSGTGDQTVMTIKMKIRKNGTTSSVNRLWFHTLDNNGNRDAKIIDWWGHGFWWGGSGSMSTVHASDVWYDITLVLDVKNQLYSMKIDGGAFDNKVISGTSANITEISASDVISGFRIGWDTTSTTADDYFDIADISVKTSAASSYDEKLDFENNTKFTGTTSAWSSNSKWTSTGISIIQREKIYADAEHKNVAKLWQTSSTDTFINITHNIPAGTIGSDGTLGIEWSYFEHLYARVDLTVKGVDSAGNAKSLSVLTYTGNNWDYKFCGVNQANDMPKDGENWRRVRVILDLNKNEVQMNTWDETEPKRSAGKLETDDTNTTVLADFADITSAVFQVRPRTWDDGRYMYLDDMRVYKVAPLAYAGAEPFNGEVHGVSVTKNPEILFNNGIVKTDATLSNFKLIDSKGSEVSGKVGINGQRNGIEFIPDNDLKGNETYTLQANNVKVEDMFGAECTISKTITFTTEPVLTLVDFEFSSEEVVAGELGVTIEVKSKDKLARNIYAALAIYNKATGELVSINTGSINAVTNTFNLTTEVPAEGTYYAKAFVWNTDANAVPYFTAQSIGLN